MNLPLNQSSLLLRRPYWQFLEHLLLMESQDFLLLHHQTPQIPEGLLLRRRHQRR
jgi:hypothetical protein